VRACRLRLVAVVQDEHSLDQEEPTKPTPMSVATVRDESTASIASGSTSKRATATTIPPVNAINVISSR
jgi:hypothetical protein